MKKILLASSILLTLAACSSKQAEPEVVEVIEPEVIETPVVLPAEPRWERAGTSEQEAEQQLSRCRYDVGMNASNLESSRVNALIEDCMKKEGYQWVSE